MAERIYWNEEEVQRLCEITFGIHTSNPQITLVQCLNKAMGMIPPHRRRKIQTLTMVPWLIDYVRHQHHELKEYRKRVIASEPPPPPSVEEVLLKATIPQIVSVLTTKLLGVSAETQRVLTEMRQQFQALAAGQGAAQPQAPRRRKLVIIGLKPNQANEVTERFRTEDIEIQCIEANKYTGLPKCDSVLCMTGFVDHSTYEAAKTARPDMVHVNGGVTSLVNRIREYVDRGGRWVFSA